MARPCTICTHPQRREIDTLLATGTSAAEAARSFHLGERSMRRHADTHLPAALVQAAQTDDDARDLDVLNEAKTLYWRTKRILADADDAKTSLAAIREARPTLELLGKLLGDLDDRPQVNVLIAPQWLTIRSALMTALLPYPEARTAVAMALVEAERAVDSQ